MISTISTNTVGRLVILIMATPVRRRLVSKINSRAVGLGSP